MTPLGSKLRVQGRGQRAQPEPSRPQAGKKVIVPSPTHCLFAQLQGSLEETRIGFCIPGAAGTGRGLAWQGEG